MMEYWGSPRIKILGCLCAIAIVVAAPENDRCSLSSAAEKGCSDDVNHIQCCIREDLSKLLNPPAESTLRGNEEANKDEYGCTAFVSRGLCISQPTEMAQFCCATFMKSCSPDAASAGSFAEHKNSSNNSGDILFDNKDDVEEEGESLIEDTEESITDGSTTSELLRGGAAGTREVESAVPREAADSSKLSKIHSRPLPDEGQLPQDPAAMTTNPTTPYPPTSSPSTGNPLTATANSKADSEDMDDSGLDTSDADWPADPDDEAIDKGNTDTAVSSAACAFIDEAAEFAINAFEKLNATFPQIFKPAALSQLTLDPAAATEDRRRRSLSNGEVLRKLQEKRSQRSGSTVADSNFAGSSSNAEDNDQYPMQAELLEAIFETLESSDAEGLLGLLEMFIPYTEDFLAVIFGNDNDDGESALFDFSKVDYYAIEQKVLAFGSEIVDALLQCDNCILPLVEAAFDGVLLAPVNPDMKLLKKLNTRRHNKGRIIQLYPSQFARRGLALLKRYFDALRKEAAEIERPEDMHLETFLQHLLNAAREVLPFDDLAGLFDHLFHIARHVASNVLEHRQTIFDVANDLYINVFHCDAAKLEMGPGSVVQRIKDGLEAVAHAAETAVNLADSVINPETTTFVTRRLAAVVDRVLQDAAEKKSNFIPALLGNQNAAQAAEDFSEEVLIGQPCIDRPPELVQVLVDQIEGLDCEQLIAMVGCTPSADSIITETLLKRACKPSWTLFCGAEGDAAKLTAACNSSTGNSTLGAKGDVPAKQKSAAYFLEGISVQMAVAIITGFITIA